MVTLALHSSLRTLPFMQHLAALRRTDLNLFWILSKQHDKEVTVAGPSVGKCPSRKLGNPPCSGASCSSVPALAQSPRAAPAAYVKANTVGSHDEGAAL